MDFFRESRNTKKNETKEDEKMTPYYDDSLPVGFAFGLAMDMDAMNHFSNMSEAEKEELLNRARDAKSKEEMERIISQIHSDQSL